MFDAHCHLQFNYADRDAIIARAIAAGTTGLLVSDYDATDRHHLLELAKRSGVFATIGLHPWAVRDSPTTVTSELLAITDAIASPGVVGLGEMGLDFASGRDTQALQLSAFRAQLDLARLSGKPVVIHSVRANADLLGVFKKDGAPRGFVHGFTGSKEDALAFARFGLAVSVGNALTERKQKLIDAVRAVGLSMLLVETDAPIRGGEKNREQVEPGDLNCVIDVLAKVFGISVADVSSKTSANVRTLFGLNDEQLEVVDVNRDT